MRSRPHAAAPCRRCRMPPNGRSACRPPCSSGRNAIATTMIPMPPNHCSIDRQSSNPAGRSSRPENTVEPVVVSPDISLEIGVGEAGVRVVPRRKGIAPKKGSTTQTAVVKRNICLEAASPRRPSSHRPTPPDRRTEPSRWPPQRRHAGVVRYPPRNPPRRGSASSRPARRPEGRSRIRTGRTSIMRDPLARQRRSRQRKLPVRGSDGLAGSKERVPLPAATSAATASARIAKLRISAHRSRHCRPAPASGGEPPVNPHR